MIFYRKKKLLFLGLILVLIIISLLLTTREIKVRSQVYGDSVELLFSRESGFYDEEFLLSISTESKGEIYYTLDGSTPTKDSIPYNEPILIKDASQNPNVYSSLTNVSAGFYTDLIEKHTGENPPGYESPDSPVDKATIVRAVIYYGNNTYSSSKTKTYFVGYKTKNDYNNVSIISLVTDPNNLFDYHNGIYTTGIAFDNFLEYEDAINWAYDTGAWNLWWTNSMNGIANEKEAVVHFYDHNKRFVIAQNCGINIHGSTSASYNQKSFNIYFRNKYSGNDKIAFNLFGNSYFPSRITLFQGGNDQLTKLQDYLVSKVCSSSNFATMKFKPYILFLDGEYWGFYWLTEKYDENFFSYYYDVAPNNVIMVKGGEIKVGNDSEGNDYKAYINMRTFCETADFSSMENVEKLYDLIDVDSFIDYYATMIYIGRYVDWPPNDYNVGLWKTRKKSDGKYNDAKWRWILYDVNSDPLDAGYIEKDTIETTMNASPFFRNIMTIGEIRNKLLDKIIELGNTTFSYGKVQNIIDEYTSLYETQLTKTVKRFFVDSKVSAYYEHIEEIETFYKYRNNYIKEMTSKYR